MNKGIKIKPKIRENRFTKPIAKHVNVYVDPNTSMKEGILLYNHIVEKFNLLKFKFGERSEKDLLGNVTFFITQSDSFTLIFHLFDVGDFEYTQDIKIVDKYSNYINNEIRKAKLKKILY